jgi:hypothetical protein
MLGESCTQFPSCNFTFCWKSEGRKFFFKWQLYFILIEVRQEAVQQALAAMQSRPKPSLPMPSKRTSVMGRAPDPVQQESGILQFFLVVTITLYRLELVDIKSGLAGRKLSTWSNGIFHQDYYHEIII